MLVYEYKLSGSKKQYVAIDDAIRVVQFIRNKSLRLWMDGEKVSKNDLQTNCKVLAQEYPFARKLNSMARQAAADRTWFAISRFYENCKNKKPGKKDYPKFQHNNRSVEYKTTGWKIAVPPHYTTQNCSGCGTKVQKSLSVRTHICPKCGLVIDRDQNAALNILHKALSPDEKGTEGHSGTSTDVAVQNASGNRTSTASSKQSRGKSGR
jgi:transposase